METIADLPVLLFDNGADWRRWLAKNNTQKTSVWLKIAKKASGKESITYHEALDEGLCYGWIDAQKKSYDQDYFLQKFCPRQPKSIWSKVNVEKIAALIAAGKMETAGLAAVESAKLDGRWEQAYESQSTMVVPLDLQTALDANPLAKEFFETLNKTNAYSYLWRIQTAKKPDTRKARIDKFIEMLNRGEKLH
jgi:uncharacterized protein YdeI (YjbR/CyaY-like superfamily)